MLRELPPVDISNRQSPIKYIVTPMSIKVTAHSQRSDRPTGQFHKGITLQNYMKLSDSPSDNRKESDELSSSSDLCQESGLIETNKNIRLVTFAIDEGDEENYDENNPNEFFKAEVSTKPSIHPTNSKILERNTRKNTRAYSKDDRSRKLEFSHGKGFRIKNPSNSPKKLVSMSPFKKEMFRSLYGDSFRETSLRTSQQSIFSSTIQNKFLKLGQSPSISKKQNEFKEKNKRHYNQVIKLQSVVQSRNTTKLDILNIRIEGIRDRFYERRSYGKGV